MNKFVAIFLLVSCINAYAGALEGIDNARHDKLYRKGDVTHTRDTNFYCVGTEPFSWSLEINPDKFLYTQFDRDKRSKMTMQHVFARVPEGFVSDYARIYQTRSYEKHQSVTLVLRQVSGGCAAGMVEQAYEFDLTLITPDFVRIGCCNPISF